MNGYSRDEMERILKDYGDMVYRMAIVQVKKQDVAEDIYQNVWMKLLRQKNRIEPEEHLKAWLLRSTINCCKDYWKSAWVQRISWKGNEPAEDFTDNAAENNDTKQQSGHVTECVQALPEKYRTIIHLYYYEGYHHKEIAQMLHMNENTVYSRLARGRERLRKMLQKEAGEYEY